MPHRYSLLKQYQLHSKLALEELKSKGYLTLDSSKIWQILAYELEHFDVSTEIIFHNLSVAEIVGCIENYLNDYGTVVSEIIINKSMLSHVEDTRLEKAEIKFKGEIWAIHKSDKDVFPSQPHAHNYDKHYKLHLGNGRLYRKKDYIDSIRTKDLICLRALISERLTDIVLPTLEE